MNVKIGGLYWHRPSGKEPRLVEVCCEEKGKEVGIVVIYDKNDSYSPTAGYHRVKQEELSMKRDELPEGSPKMEGYHV
ncbi:MAG: hypothetical protein HGA54_00925 [Actinobacteria bacterium]|nr:hypothetical protein [Actinomycetota bacterium]